MSLIFMCDLPERLFRIFNANRSHTKHFPVNKRNIIQIILLNDALIIIRGLRLNYKT